MNVKANVMDGKTVVRTISCDVTMPTDPEILKALAEDAFTIAAQSRMRALGDLNRKDGRLTDAAIAAAGTLDCADTSPKTMSGGITVPVARPSRPSVRLTA